MKVFVLEDDPTISFALKTYLGKHGFDCHIYESIADCDNANLSDFDLAILDVNLPDGSGFDYLKYIKGNYDLPVLMLTVKDGEEHVLKGFSMGADEYITKPFSLPVLKARIDNIFKRKYQPDTIQFNELKLKPKLKTAFISERNLDLNKQEYQILEVLLLNRKVTIPRERLLDLVWENNYYGVNDNTLTVTVKRLRNKLGDYGRYIETVRGIGYRWEDKDE